MRMQEARGGLAGWWERRMITVNGIARLASQGVRVLRSGCFDGDWYLRQRPNLAGTRWPALFHYLRRGCVDDPSRDFCSQEYLHMNPDVARAGIPAILHFERYGSKSGRLVSLLETGAAPRFPQGAESYMADFGLQPPVHRRTAVFASYAGNGRIEPCVLHYLRGLHEVCDNIVFVADNPLFPGERAKLKGLVACMLVSRHGEYDFGSYKRGWDWARTSGALAESDELLLCNDSCYGPFHPFGSVFAAMAARPCDFWGLSMFQILDKQTKSLHYHFQSFFLVFRRRVFESEAFTGFMASIRKLPEPTREHVVDHYEFNLTRHLEDAGFIWDSFIPQDFCIQHGVLPTYLSATVMAHHGMPLLKVKTFGENPWAESPRKALRVARRLNPALHADLLPHHRARLAAFRLRMKTLRHPHIDLAGHQASFPGKVARIQKRVAAGGRIRATFLVSSPAMFPSRPLFEAMRADSRFEPRVLVIPDFNADNDLDGAIRVLDMLTRDMPGAAVLPAWTDDEVVPWRDISVDSDLVVYNSPYANSHFFYNPRFAFGRDFLPIHVNYGYYRSVYDRHVMRTDIFAYFWKALFENEDVLAEYRQCSVIGGSNAWLTGYCKMDALAEKVRRSGERKCILIAPHHSVEGGMNRVLGLSNFARYERLFFDLPRRHPEIDFIFRPHPALFKVLASPRLWGAERAEAWCSQFRAHPNVQWSDGGDYFQDFADSDAIIQDCGSFLVEYFYTGKPCCYLLKSPKDAEEKFTPFGQDCLGHCHIAYDEAAILRFIDEVVVQGRDPLAEARERFRRERVMLNHPRAAAVALDLIKRELGGR
jgi:hypothetical protein